MTRHTADSGQSTTGSAGRGTALLSGAAVFVVLFLIYLATLLRTVVDQDSGELVSAAHVLGIAHPTGYPLWVLLGRLFDFLPVGGTSAFRVGLLSAACSAGAGALIAVLALRLTGRWLAAIAAGLAFGLWFPTWSQAVRAEVYGLTGLLFALALFAFLCWDRERSPRQLYWLALACGFVGMHHRTAALAALPALGVALAATRPRRARVYAGAALSFVAPFLIYAYLPIRAAAGPAVNWTNPVTWGRFWDHVLATQYQGFALSHNVEQMAQEAVKLGPAVFAPEVGWSLLLAVIGVPLIVWGALWWARREPWAAGSLAVGAGLLVFWVLQWGETADLKVFLQPTGAVAALLGAAGLACAGSRFSARAARHGTVALLGVLVCGTLVRVNWERSDLSNLWQHRDRWAAMLSQLEPNAVFVSDNDVPSFVTMYLQNVEEMRPDVTLVRVVPLRTEWYVELIEDPEVREAVRAAWEDTPVSLREVARLGPPEMTWGRTAYFARELAKRLRGSRPVYALHGPWPFGSALGSEGQSQFSGPPYFVGLSEDLVQLEFEEPELAREKEAGPALTGIPGSAELVGFELERRDAGTGETVGFRAEWVLKGPPPLAHFGIALGPGSVDSQYFVRELMPNGRFIQGFPVMYGLQDLSASPEGTVYEQRGQVILPTNAPEGRYEVAVGLGLPHAEQYAGWAQVAELRIEARPRPRNGP